MLSVHPSIFDFLEQLKRNNNRQWFSKNRERHYDIRKLIKTYGKYIEGKLQKSDSIEKLKIFRINNDLRFRKDKTPYKTHFSFFYVRKKPALRGGYYVHIEPGNSFIGVGFWKPEKEDLLRIRLEFEFDADEFRDIVSDKIFQNHWGILQGDELLTAPRGFSQDHPNIDLIRKKQFLFRKSFSDEEVLSEQYLDNIVKHYEIIRPFLDYMSSVLTTNTDGESIV